MTRVTGTHSRRSPALREMLLSTTATAQKATTTQMSQTEAAGPARQCHAGTCQHDTRHQRQQYGLDNRGHAEGGREAARNGATHGIGAPRRAQGEGNLKEDDAGGDDGVENGGNGRNSHLHSLPACGRQRGHETRKRGRHRTRWQYDFNEAEASRRLYGVLQGMGKFTARVATLCRSRPVPRPATQSSSHPGR